MSKTKPAESIEETLVKSAANKSGSLASKVKMHDWLLVGIVVVVVVGFAAMLLTAGAMVTDSLAEKKAISQDIRDQVEDNNDSIDDLKQEINELKQEVQKLNEQKTIQKTN